MTKAKIKSLGAGIGWFALYACLMMLTQTIVSIAFMGGVAASGVRNETTISAFANTNLLSIVLITNLLVGGILFLSFWMRKTDIRKEWKMNGFTSKAMVLSVLVATAYSFAFALLTRHFGLDDSGMIFRSAEYYSSIVPGLGIVMMALNLLVAAPAVEEIALRGIVYTRIEKGCGTLTAILVSSVLFAVMHIAAGGMVLTFGALLMGIIFGCIFAKTNSLWVCMIAHAAANIPDFVFYYIQ